MRIRIDEIDRLITQISESDLPVNSQSVQATSDKIVTGKRRRRRQSTTTASDIIERPILEAMMKTGSLTSKEIASILPGSRMGPLVSAWVHRSNTVGVVFSDLVTRSVTPDGNKVYSLTRQRAGECWVGDRLGLPVPPNSGRALGQSGSLFTRHGCGASLSGCAGTLLNGRCVCIWPWRRLEGLFDLAGGYPAHVA